MSETEPKLVILQNGEDTDKVDFGAVAPNETSSPQLALKNLGDVRVYDIHVSMQGSNGANQEKLPQIVSFPTELEPQQAKPLILKWKTGFLGVPWVKGNVVIEYSYSLLPVEEEAAMKL